MAYFWSPIKKLLDEDLAKKLYDTGKSDAQIACICGVVPETVKNWRGRNRLRANRFKPDACVNDPEQCKKCIYWYDVNGGKRLACFCNYMLETGKRRARKEDKCFSIENRRGRRGKAVRVPADAGDEAGGFEREGSDYYQTIYG